MTDLWQLPVTASIGGREYPIHADFRDILEIFSYLQDPELPEALRWQIAMALFYEGEISPEDWEEGCRIFVEFIDGVSKNCRKTVEKPSNPGPKLIDWQQDAPVIVAEINRVAGQEIRALPFVHWWTFLAWFHAIGEGQLSTLVSVRDKLARGKKLEGWEQEYYRRNKRQVDLPKQYSKEELAEQERLKALLGS